MGHQIITQSYDEKVSKDKITMELNQICEYESDSRSGLPNKIRWFDHICKSREEAEEYIEKKDKGWYDQLAVKYYEPTKKTTSKKLENLEERAKKAYEKYSALKNKIHYEDTTAKTIGCRSCNSKLSAKYVWEFKNYCPVCESDLRPESTRQRIKAAKLAYENLQNEVKKEQDALDAKAKKKVMWLVKCEFHC